MNKISEDLPYVLINYIFQLRAVLLIQRVFRKNRPYSLLVSRYLTITDAGDSLEFTKWRNYTDFYPGDRVLIKMPSGKLRYGTINTVFPPRQDFTYAIRLVNTSPARNLYIHSNYQKTTIILLPGWNDLYYKGKQMRHIR
jgi:hypothetical protein